VSAVERFQSRATINPYRGALAQVLWRVAWDLRPESWRSRRVLRSWRDRHRGGRCVILCNGPSLNRTDFSKLDSVFTFGLNKINLLFERTAFRPSCVVAVNALVLEQNAEFFRGTELPLFLERAALMHVRPRPNIAFLHSASIHARQFARDCSVSVAQGGTVTYVALQLAFHMGFERVALVGCDHEYAETGTPHQVVRAANADASHFDPRYFAHGAAWQLPDLLQSELSYRTAREQFETAGRSVVNATAGGRLEIFERVGLEEFLA
jgi:hypothetical protein